LGSDFGFVPPERPDPAKREKPAGHAGFARRHVGGSVADVVILEKNPLESPPAEIRNIAVLETIVARESAYGR
jgi:hypothetical protein